MSNLVMKPSLSVDPSVPQSQQQAAEQQQQAAENQNQLNKATSLGGGRKRTRRTFGKMKGGFFKYAIPPYPNLPPPGYIVVNPLPLGSQSTNTATNNVETANVYANTMSNATNDSKVGGAHIRGHAKKKTQRVRKKKSAKRTTKRRKPKGKKRRIGKTKKRTGRRK